VHKKGRLVPFVEKYQPDILCLQETKAEKNQRSGLADEILTCNEKNKAFCKNLLENNFKRKLIEKIAKI
jgi:exonuclease III